METSNTGRVVVKKCIDKIDKREAILHQQQQQQQQFQQLQKERQLMYRRNNTTIIEGRKSKGRLYSLGGNEPQIKKGYRGRLDRLKTVGTFDLGSEISVLSEVARNLNEKIISGDISSSGGSARDGISPYGGDGDMSSTPGTKYTPTTSSVTPITTPSMQSTSVRNTPESYKKQLNKTMSSSDYGRSAVTFRKSPATPSFSGGGGSVCTTVRHRPPAICEFKTQHSADDCIQRKFYFRPDRKSRSLSTSGFLNRGEIILPYSAPPPLPPSSQYYHHQQQQHQIIHDDKIKRTTNQFQDSTHDTLSSLPGRMLSEDGAITSVPASVKTVEFSKSATEPSSATEDRKEFSYMKRRSMLRKSRRIVRTDSEIFREGIITGTESDDKNIMVLQNKTDIQIHHSTEEDEGKQQPTLPKPGTITTTTASILKSAIKSPSQDYTERNSSVTSSSVFSRKNSSDFDDLYSPREYQQHHITTSHHQLPMFQRQSTTDSSKNHSIEEIDAVFSDSTTDIETLKTLEKEYKELMKSNLQREYKSDGDTLDEIGKRKKYDDICKWKNQSLEHEFEVSATTTPTPHAPPSSLLVGETVYEDKMLTSSSRNSHLITTDFLVATKDLSSRIYSPESCAASAYSDSAGIVKGLNVDSSVDNDETSRLSDTDKNELSNMRVRVYSSSRLGETPIERERLSSSYDYHRSSAHQRNSDLSNGDIEMQTMPKTHRRYPQSQSLSIYTDGSGVTGDVLQLQKVTTQRPSILKIDKTTAQHKQDQQDSAATVENDTASVVKCGSIFDNPLSKFKKVNKLLKCKRFSTSALYDKKPPAVPITTASVTITSSTTAETTSLVSTSTAVAVGKTSIPQSLSTSATTLPGITALPSPSMKPLKKKRAIHLSKLSLFSQKQRKQSTPPALTLSNHELRSKSASKTKLSETSKSTCEISSKFKSSPLRFRRKSSKMDKTKAQGIKKSTNETQQQLPDACYSPLSEEFYNKTGSVRLSAMELYEKFCSEDFGGLYKNEIDDEPHSSQHEYRLEKKGLRTIGRYHKNAKLLKQRSEPKFHYLSSSMHHNTADTFYHEEEEYYYDSHPEDDDYYNRHYYYDGDPYYNEQDEYYDEYEHEEDAGFDGEYYEDDEIDHHGQVGRGQIYDEDDENMAIIMQHQEENRPKTALGAFNGSRLGFQNADDDENEGVENHQLEMIELGRVTSVSAPGSSRAYQDKKQMDLMSTSVGGGSGIGDSDVDEILLMPSGGEESKCSGSDYEEYGFENKQFTLEQSMLKSLDAFGAVNQNYRRSDSSSSARDNRRDIVNIDIDEENDILTIYKICSREYLDKSGSVTSRAESTTSLPQNEYDDDGIVAATVIDDKSKIQQKPTPKKSNEIAEIQGSPESSKKHRSLSLQCSESLQKAVSDYVRGATMSTSDQNIPLPTVELATIPLTNITLITTNSLETVANGGATTTTIPIAGIKTTCLDLSDTGGFTCSSLELLSTNSSSGGTMHSHSTLTEYAFDTVKNLNMDSCSTNSKLSLSLKSEIFDDFTITPDDLKQPIAVQSSANKCDFEDFTLTPEDDGSLTSSSDPEKQLLLQFKIERLAENQEQDQQKLINDDDDDGGGGRGGGDGDDENLVRNENSYGDSAESSYDRNNKPSLPYDDQLDDNVIKIVNEFLTNERNLPKAEDFMPIITTKTTDCRNNEQKPTHEDKIDDNDDNIAKLETSRTANTTITTFKTIDSSSYSCYEDSSLDNEGISLFTSEITKEFDKLFLKAASTKTSSITATTAIAEDTLTSSTISDSCCDKTKKLLQDDEINDQNRVIDDNNDNNKLIKLSPRCSNSADNLLIAVTEAAITTVLKPIQQSTIVTEKQIKSNNDDYDDDEENEHEQIQDDDESSSLINSKTHVTSIIPTRCSMQKLEPIEMYDTEEKYIQQQHKQKAFEKLKNLQKKALIATSSTGSTASSTIAGIKSKNHQQQQQQQKSTLLHKHKRSQSLGNLNKKTKCFPL